MTSVHFVIEAVDRLPLEGFRVNHRGPGAKQFSPHLMLALLIYSHAKGLLSSRMIERATPRDVAIPYLTAGTHPDHDTICKFHRENLEAFRESFIDVLELAGELKWLKLGKVSPDGTQLRANASIDQNVSYQRAVKIREQLRPDIDDLLAQAESADAEEQCKLSDPDARIMCKNKRASFTQSDNAQAAVAADGSQLVVGQHVSQSAGDFAEWVNGVAGTHTQTIPTIRPSLWRRS